MISDAYDIDTFLKAIQEKDLSEIISFADREALAAWRQAYRQKKGGTLSDLPARYENTLEELISFPRAALPFKPKVNSDVNDRNSAFIHENTLGASPAKSLFYFFCCFTIRIW
jgi:hypothetical protein